MIPLVLLRLPCFLAVICVCFAWPEFRRVCRRYELDVGIQRASWEGRGRPLTPVFPALPTAGALYEVISIVIKLITLITKKQCIVKLKCWLASRLTLSSTVVVTVKNIFQFDESEDMYLMIFIKSATNDIEDRDLKFYERQIGLQMLACFSLVGSWRPPVRPVNCLGFLRKKNLV